MTAQNHSKTSKTAFQSTTNKSYKSPSKTPSDNFKSTRKQCRCAFLHMSAHFCTFLHTSPHGLQPYEMHFPWERTHDTNRSKSPKMHESVSVTFSRHAAMRASQSISSATGPRREHDEYGMFMGFPFVCEVGAPWAPLSVCESPECGRRLRASGPQESPKGSRMW